MKTIKRQLILGIVVLFCVATSAFSQDQSLTGQFNDILDKAESYESYKVIKTSKLLKFKSVMLDSLVAYKNSINALDAQLAQMKADLDIIKNDYTLIKTQLNESEVKNATIGLLGFNINKGSYNIVLWSFVVLLMSAIAILYMRVKHVCAVVKRVKSAYSKIMDEYRTQRHQSVEKQIKLKRELQTVQNRLEMMQSLEEPVTA